MRLAIFNAEKILNVFIGDLENFPDAIIAQDWMEPNVPCQIIDGVPAQIPPSQEAIDAKAAADEAARRQGIYEEAYRRQYSGVDANFYGLLLSIVCLSRASNVALAPKAAATLAWVEAIWAERGALDADTSKTASDYSQLPTRPYSFDEVRAETS